MTIIGLDKNGDEIAKLSVSELDTMFKQIRNKTIDEFVKMAKEVKYQDGALSDIDLEYIAQQLKAGGTDG